MHSNLGEPTGETEIWSNTLGYLQDIQFIERELRSAYLREDTGQCVKLADELFVLLARLMKKEEREHIEELLREAANKHSISTRMKGTPAAKSKGRESKTDCLRIIRELRFMFGDFQEEKGLTFRKGIDPNEAWALG